MIQPKLEKKMLSIYYLLQALCIRPSRSCKDLITTIIRDSVNIKCKYERLIKRNT